MPAEQEMRAIDTVVIHHSASALTTTRETIRSWHLDRGWDDIGYHYVIEARGELKYGRPMHVPGAHARGHNANSLGVCVVGNNAQPKNAWTAAQVVSLRLLIYTLELALGGVRVVGHRDLDRGTLCPGIDVAQVLVQSQAFIW